MVGEGLLCCMLKVLWVWQVGDSRAAARWELGGERDFTVCLWNLNWIPYYCSLRDAGKIDINVKLLLATELCSFICDAVQKMGHMGPQLILRCMCLKVKMFECER